MGSNRNMIKQIIILLVVFFVILFSILAFSFSHEYYKNIQVVEEEYISDIKNE